jgi:hypothetical protein
VLLGIGRVAEATPVYLPSGPQTGVSIATVLAGGWSLCYAQPMATPIGASAQNVLNACTGSYLMMAGLETGANSFIVLAATTRADAIIDTGQTSNTHLSNGSQWWFSPSWSWGFTAAGDTVANNQCDVSDSPTSMCLHTFDGVGGYRIDNITGLNASVGYQKWFFQADAGPAAVPEPATLSLVGLGLAAAIRRRFRR